MVGAAAADDDNDAASNVCVTRGATIANVVPVVRNNTPDNENKRMKKLLLVPPRLIELRRSINSNLIQIQKFE